MLPTPSTALALSRASLGRRARALAWLLALLGAAAVALAALLLPLAELPEPWLPPAIGLAGLAALAWAGACRSVLALRSGLSGQPGLTAQVQRLAQLAEQSDQALVLSDPQRGIVWVNEAFTRQSGYSFEEACGRPLGELLGSRQACPAAQQALESMLVEAGAARAELQRCGKDGHVYRVIVKAHELLDEQGRRVGFVDRESLADPSWPRTLQPAAVADEGARGPGRQDVGGPGWSRPAAMLAAPGVAPPPAWPVRAAGADALNVSNGADRSTGSDGSSGSSGPSGPSGLSGTSGLCGPSGPAGRAPVLERVEMLQRHAGRHPGFGFALLVIGVHQLAQVADAYGASAAGGLLGCCAERLRDTLRPGDLLLRLADDRFAALLEGIRHEADAVTVTERALAALAEPADVQGHRLQAVACAGLVLPEPRCGADELLGRAELALGEACRRGRGCWARHDAELQARNAQALALAADLKLALAGRQLSVDYQPSVHLRSRRWASVEALLRWRHPQRGEIPAAEFTPVAEDHGLMDEIDDFALRTACSQFAAWLREFGRDAPAMLGVNLSASQLRQPGLAAEVGALLDELGLQPQQLQVEVTESLAWRHPLVLANLAALKKQGVRVALDDFGTANSSLAGLHRLPVDCVKIDRSFVQQATEVEYHRVLIEATTRVARTLGMCTVAQGVETEAQAELLLSLGCDRAQGVLFGPPMGADAVRASLSTASADTLT